MFDVKGRRWLITGGTGSFGKSLVKTLMEEFEPARLALYSRDELKQYEMEADMIATYGAKRVKEVVRFFIGDVRDPARLNVAMRGCDVVVHAAALKHVPIAEYNPMECVKTNIMGAENVIRASIDNGVDRVIALSTDKACNPINLYGATKLASDKQFVAANNIVGGKRTTRFAVVRYGNVIGSRGSVVPFFRKLAKQGETLPITHEDMTRFWITLEQGVRFVLSSFGMMRGGEIFVPKIPSVNIMILAKVLGNGLPTKIVGIRPGEKLHEVMVSTDDAWCTVELDDRYVIEPSFTEYHRVSFKDDGRASVVDPRFYYASDNNDDKLDEFRLQGLLEEAGV